METNSQRITKAIVPASMIRNYLPPKLVGASGMLITGDVVSLRLPFAFVAVNERYEDVATLMVYSLMSQRLSAHVALLARQLLFR